MSPPTSGFDKPDVRGGLGGKGPQGPAPPKATQVKIIYDKMGPQAPWSHMKDPGL